MAMVTPRVGLKVMFLEHLLRSSKKYMELASNGAGVAGAGRVWHDMLVELLKFLEWSSTKHALSALLPNGKERKHCCNSAAQQVSNEDPTCDLPPTSLPYMLSLRCHG